MKENHKSQCLMIVKKIKMGGPKPLARCRSLLLHLLTFRGLTSSSGSCGQASSSTSFWNSDPCGLAVTILPSFLPSAPIPNCIVSSKHGAHIEWFSAMLQRFE